MYVNDLCMGGLAGKGDIEACDGYLDVRYKQNCYDGAYYVLAMKNKDADICEKINAEEYKSECLKIINAQE